MQSCILTTCRLSWAIKLIVLRQVRFVIKHKTTTGQLLTTFQKLETLDNDTTQVTINNSLHHLAQDVQMSTSTLEANVKYKSHKHSFSTRGNWSL